jgi:hypothetical protein
MQSENHFEITANILEWLYVKVAKITLAVHIILLFPESIYLIETFLVQI